METANVTRFFIKLNSNGSSIEKKSERHSHLVDRGSVRASSQGTSETEDGSACLSRNRMRMHQSKWHWQVHCAPPKERESVANRLALFLGMVV